MRLYTVIALTVVLSVLTAGCTENTQESAGKQMINHELINTYNNIVVQNAIISQHTLFPYHFVKNGVELNELGSRDLNVLAEHFLKYPGELNVRRGDISEDLYKARINFVIGKLRVAGVRSDQLSVSDGMPGGTGKLSEEILIIIEENRGRISSD